jgi:translation initiation factor 2B subunit (eIF-2B alpha/beta/delta family)
MIGPLRFPVLVIDWIYTFLFLELGIVSILRYTKKPKILRSSQEIGYSVLFIGAFLLWLLNIIGDFYFSGMTRYMLLYLGNLLFFILEVIFVFLTEMSSQNHPIFLKNYPLTIFNSIIALFSVFITAIFIELVRLFTMIIWSISLIIFFISIAIRKNQMKDNKTRSFFYSKIIFISILFIFGSVLSLGFLSTILSLNANLIGGVSLLLGVCLLFFLTHDLPSINLFISGNLIEDIYILNNNGACLYHGNSPTKIMKFNDHLISGAISILDNMLKQLTQSKAKGFAVIRKKDKILNIYSSKFITAVLFSKEESSAIEYYLKKLVIRIENVYRDVLLSWNGKTSIFTPIKSIIEEIFPSQ